MSAVQPRTRVKVAKIEDRFVVRPVAALGKFSICTVPADGLIIGRAGGSRSTKSDRRVLVRLLRERQIVEREIAVAGCDPAINLASEYLHRHKDTSTVGGGRWGVQRALDALKRKEVHMAGLHILDAKTGESNLPYLRRHLQGDDYIVVTFAAWEEGLIVRAGNPKRIRGVEDLVRANVTLVNREEGAAARMLLDQRLQALGIDGNAVKGYSMGSARISRWLGILQTGKAMPASVCDPRRRSSASTSFPCNRPVTIWSCRSDISSHPGFHICSTRLPAVSSEPKSKRWAAMT